jgi:hypothetical protein
MANIFVSFTSSDREWAFWIAKELEALGHTPHVHSWEIEGGHEDSTITADRGGLT